MLKYDCLSATSQVFIDFSKAPLWLFFPRIAWKELLIDPIYVYGSKRRILEAWAIS